MMTRHKTFPKKYKIFRFDQNLEKNSLFYPMISQTIHVFLLPFIFTACQDCNSVI